MNTVVDKILRHVVLMGFNESVTAAQLEEIVVRFSTLKEACPGVVEFEWGENVSVEGLDGGHSHCFVLSFASEQDRDAYLPHPAHKEFADWVGQYIECVTVLDYWARPGMEAGQ